MSPLSILERIRGLSGTEVLARLLLWAGLLLPIAYAPNESTSQILSHGLSTSNLVRGGLPIVFLLMAWLLTSVRPFPVAAVEWPIVGFCALALLSSVWSVVPWTTALKAVSLATGYACLLMLVRLHERHGERSLNALAWLAHVVVLPALIAAIVVPGRAFVALGFDPTLRLQGLLPSASADTLAYLAAAGIILIAAGWRPPLPRASRGTLPALVSLALVAADLAAIVLSRTRTALGLLVIGLAIVYGWHVLRRVVSPAQRLALGLAVVVLVSLALAVTLIPTSPLHHFLLRGQTLAQALTLTGRTTTWSDALSLWSRRPLQGFGYYAGHRFAVQRPHGALEVSNLDNTWVEALVDVGLLGALFLALAIAVGTANLVALWRRDRAVDHGRLALLVTGVLAGFVNPSLELYSYQMIVLTLVLAGGPRLSGLGVRWRPWSELREATGPDR